MIPSNSTKPTFFGTPPRGGNQATTSTPTGTPPAGGGSLGTAELHPRISAALEKVIPGLDANRLFQSLDSLFGNRGEYTLVGSASMHIHALECRSEPDVTLPMPNDIDVVVTDRGIGKLDLANQERLNALNLRRDADLPHVLYVTRPGHDDLKIDVVKDRTPGFAKYTSNPQDIEDIQVGRLDHCLKDYRQRLEDPEFIQECGSKKQAEIKIKPWLDYFEKQPLEGQSNTAANSPPHKRLRLFD